MLHVQTVASLLIWHPCNAVGPLPNLYLFRIFRNSASASENTEEPYESAFKTVLK